VSDLNLHDNSVIPVKTGIQKYRFLLEFIPMKIGAGMTGKNNYYSYKGYL
jgi:hypothetical protein